MLMAGEPCGNWASIQIMKSLINSRILIQPKLYVKQNIHPTNTRTKTVLVSGYVELVIDLENEN